MGVHGLDHLLRPGRIAVVGASEKPGSVGGVVFQNLVGGGFEGDIYPVNRKRSAVHGRLAYPSVADLPQTPDLVIVCTPAATVPQVVHECGVRGTRGVLILSAGFAEAGPQGAQLQEQLQREIAAFDGLRVIGPNCLGLLVPAINLNASFAATGATPGRIAFISQSGALCTAVLDWAKQEGIGFSCCVSIGNTLDVGFADLIDYLGQDPATRSVVLYIESISDARAFMSAARSCTRTKPIVAYKAGRFPQSAAAASSHTAAMACDFDVCAAAFQRAGIEMVSGVEELFDCAELLARPPIVKGPALAVVTNAGGPGVMAVDALLSRGGTLARLCESTTTRLGSLLPAFASRANPIDILGDAPPDRFAATVAAVAADTGVDAVLVLLTPQTMTDPTATAQVVGALATRAGKPLLATWMGGSAVEQGRKVLSQMGVPTYPTPEQAVHAFMHMVSYARNLEVLYETPRAMAVDFLTDRHRSKAECERLLGTASGWLPTVQCMELIRAYGIPSLPSTLAGSEDEAVTAADHLGYPVVLKIASKQIVHKSEVDGVALNLRDADVVRASYRRIVGHAKAMRPDAVIDGVTVQPMKDTHGAVELILGARRDPAFGMAVMIGAGGVQAELLGDRAVALPPLNERLARRTLESLRIWPLLRGFRGKPAMSVDRIIEALIRFSYLVADHPRIRELDINPLAADPGGIVALDARVMIDPPALAGERRPSSHLAITPYPDQYQSEVSLTDGTRVHLRPIRPEDEPAWHEFLAACSAETIRWRFFSSFRQTTHAMASRFCFVDYDREMAIVAETRVGAARKLAGVARLVADADHRSAEYAILIADPWQSKGLGLAMTRFSLEVAGAWGLQQVVAQTMPDNDRMISCLRETGFGDIHLNEDGLTEGRAAVGVDRPARHHLPAHLP